MAMLHKRNNILFVKKNRASHALLFSFSLLCLLFSSLLPHIASATPLKQALEAAYHYHPQLQAQISAVKATHENAPQALSGWLPNITARYERGRDFMKRSSGELEGMTDDRTLTITQPLFRGGGTLASMSQAKKAILSAHAQLQNIEQRVLLEAVTAYMDVVRDEEVLELSQRNLDVLKEHRSVTQTRFDLGEVTQTDVAQSIANVAQARTELQSSKGQLEASKASYHNAIGQWPSVVIMPASPVILEASRDELIEISMIENPTIQAALYGAEASKHAVNVQKANLLPDINLRAIREEQEGNLNLGGDLDTDTVSVEFSIPLYQSGAQYSRIRQAKYQAEQGKHELLQTRHQVKESVIQAYEDFLTAKVSIDSNKASVEAFDTALQGTIEEAKAGARTTLDVLDAEQDLFEARVNLAVSRRDHIVSSYVILSQIGRLTPSVLSLAVDGFDAKAHYNKTKFKLIGF